MRVGVVIRHHKFIRVRGKQSGRLGADRSNTVQTKRSTHAWLMCSSPPEVITYTLPLSSVYFFSCRANNTLSHTYEVKGVIFDRIHLSGVCLGPVTQLHD